MVKKRGIWAKKGGIVKGQDGERSLESLKLLVKDFCEDRNWDEPHNPKDLAVGVVTEASELLELFRFVSEEESLSQMKEVAFRERVGDELADTLCFLLRFAQKYQFDLSLCLKNKLSKNAKKYPSLKKR